MPRLRTTVHVVDLEGRTRAFGQGEDLPDWAAEQITNPDVWEGELPEHLQPEQDPSQPPETAPVEEPPRSGKGSSRDAWAAYAAVKGVDVTEGASREDIIAVLAEHGLVENA